MNASTSILTTFNIKCFQLVSGLKGESFTGNSTSLRIAAPLLPFPGSSRCRRPRACAGFCSPAGPLQDWCTTASDTGSDGHTGTHKHKVNAAVPQTSEGSNNKSIYSGSEIRDTVTANIFFYLPFLQSYRILCDCMTYRHFWISTLNFFFLLRV